MQTKKNLITHSNKPH